MPELPEVETIKRDLASRLPGAQLRNLKVLLVKIVRPGQEAFRKLLLGKTLEAISRRGKLLIFEFGESVLLVHLGLTGSLILKESFPPPHTHVIFEFDKGTLFYADLRQFGWLEAVPRKDLALHSFYASLGPDALGISPSQFERLILSSRRKIKALLLDQKKIAGLGNIYTDEVLFRAGIHPERPAATLSQEEIKRLYSTMREVLLRAIELRGSSVRNYVDGKGRTGRFQEEHLVYGKRGRPCLRCGTPLEYRVVATRGTTFCPKCQSLP
ncbi:bifunctional DNA-formamidopyrimidine glycosylase/DNA-(apurinic or apyrimidinic site) lyase [Thermosulfurimonas dismutans]|uniref:Formamidopyrimidine-DNA glycosylase n=1 Tax=Thermosulfurimonas dismutans TaxID=999894 RepID=A0A179D367_9BACT|nr:bifunctional DNA-formamidopyrimidine glycosylase/DNA-(apurinic or apyrimidinic site) lyase [Thermosulfurimonas dismutans]OAQ20524.1 Formamidopyrimidine-DNA glycosylase [Thermosulfurimonas dismutans]